MVQAVTPDELEIDQPSTTAGRHSVLGIVCVCLLAIAGAVLYVHVAEPFKRAPTFCGGVGLAGPPASTAESAFSAWLASRSDQPPAADWRRDGTTYTNRTYRHADGHGLRTVSVGRGGYDFMTGTQNGPDQWSVVGACV